MENILVFSRRFYPDCLSGTETVIFNVTSQLARYFNLSIVCGWRNSPNLIPASAYGVNLSKAGKLKSYFLMNRAGRHRITEKKPRVLLSNSIEVPLLKKIPAIIIFHDVNFGEVNRILVSRVKEMYYRWKLNQFTKIVAVSHSSANILRKWNIPDKNIYVIHSGVDSVRFNIPTKALSSKNFIISYPSRIVPGKGQHILIEAVRRLPEEIRKNLEVWIAGNPQDLGYLENLKVLSIGLPVLFYASPTDILPFYQGAHAIVFPTIIEEGFGFTAVEGMACGKPIIFSNWPAIIEATGGIGLSIKKGDIEELSLSILKLYNNRELGQTLGRKGRKWIESNYSWEKTGRKYYDLIIETMR